MEQIANLLKGAATRQLIDEDRHPLAEYAEAGERPPRAWASRGWKVYLDCSELAIDEAIAYVERIPKEGKRPQDGLL